MARFALIEKIWNFHTVERLPLNQTSLLFSRTQQLAIDDNESSNDGSKPKNFLPVIFFHLFWNWMPVSKIPYQSLRMFSRDDSGMFCTLRTFQVGGLFNGTGYY